MSNGKQKPMHMEFLVRAVPRYMKDHIDEAQKGGEIPPGHMFLLYFQGMAHSGVAYYEMSDKKRKRRLSDINRDSAWNDFLAEIDARNASMKGLYGPIKEKKLKAISSCATYGEGIRMLNKGLIDRQKYIQSQLTEDHPSFTWQASAKLVAPLITGIGNPHPAEVGFSFLLPYGIPYIPGSGIKGAFRRAAEEISASISGSGGWNLAKVWVLFGFDATSAPFCEGSQDSSHWMVYKQAYENLRENKGTLELLETWIRLLNQEELPADPKKFLDALYDDQTLRRSIHWQGILCFNDAFPEGDVSMGVDILNPHHKTYYESGLSSPHDAEQPIPVYFLVLKPGVDFTFKVTASKDRLSLLGLSGECQQLLDLCFRHACHCLGFGAKTSVGYGAMEPNVVTKGF